MVDAVSPIVNDLSQTYTQRKAVGYNVPVEDGRTAARYRQINETTQKQADAAEQRAREDVLSAREASILSSTPPAAGATGYAAGGAGGAGQYQVERTRNGQTVDVRVARDESESPQVSRLADETQRALLESTQAAQDEQDNRENVVRLPNGANDNRIQAYENAQPQRTVASPSYRPDIKAGQDELGTLRRVDTYV